MPSFPNPERLRQMALAARAAQVERQRREEEQEKQLALAQAAERRRRRVHRSKVMRILREAKIGIARAAVEGLKKCSAEIQKSIAADVATELAKLGFKIYRDEGLDQNELMVQVGECSREIRHTIKVASRLDLGFPGFYEALSDADELPEYLGARSLSIDAIEDLGGLTFLANTITKQQTRLGRLLESECALDQSHSSAIDESDRVSAASFVQAIQRVSKLLATLAKSLTSLSRVHTTELSKTDEQQAPGAAEHEWISIEYAWPSIDLAEHTLAPSFDAGFVGWISSTSGEGLLIELKSILQRSAEAGLNACSVDLTMIAPNPIRWSGNSVKVIRYQDRPIGIFPQTVDLFCWLIRCMGFSAEMASEGCGRSRVTITWAEADPELGGEP